MTDNYFPKAIDNDLFNAVINEDFTAIKKCIGDGGDINAIDKYNDNMIIKYLQEKESESDIKLIKYLVDNGINTNFENEGFNCLFNAYLANRADIVKYLLEHGTNAQCIETDCCETLLDWIEFDIRFEEDDERTTKEWLDNSREIANLLKQYGATTVEKCRASVIEDYLKMFGSENTGLFTRKGYIEIKDIPNVKQSLIDDFNTWKEKSKVFMQKTWDNEDVSIEELRENNNYGLSIIKQIKKLLPENIKVQFNYVIPEDYGKNKARNIKELVIENEGGIL